MPPSESNRYPKDAARGTTQAAEDQRTPHADALGSVDWAGDSAGRGTDQEDQPLTLVIEQVPLGRKARGRVSLVVAQTLGVSLGEARSLLSRLPVTLSRRFTPAEATRTVAFLDAWGTRTRIERTSPDGVEGCPYHPELFADSACSRCGRRVCGVCVAQEATAWCADCVRQARRKRVFFQARVCVLLAVAVVVAVWAMRDVVKRRARTRWERPLRVALVLLRPSQFEDNAFALLRERTRTLASTLGAEAHRYRALGFEPFSFDVWGPVEVARPPPGPEGEDWLGLGRYAAEFWWYRRQVNTSAGLAAVSYDAVIYAFLRPPLNRRRQSIEGLSQNGGWFGSVEVEFSQQMVDFALFVVAHELLHTLGATDKYDSTGKTLIPAGLAEPFLVPLFPQRKAEIMARNRVLSPGRERPPDTLDELGVGPVTAGELSWQR